MTSESKVSRGYLTVVPKSIRKAAVVQEGDILSWAIEADRIVVVPRRRGTITGVTGIIAHGGDAVRDKRRVQRGEL